MPAEATRENLRQSVADNREQQALVDESRQLLTDLIRNELASELRLAVAEGVQAAMTREAMREFWSAGAELLNEQIEQRAGRWLFKGVGVAVTRLLWAGFFLYAIWSFAGWAGIKFALTPRGPL